MYQNHIVLGRSLNLANIHRDALEALSPDHNMWMLSQRWQATVHTPDQETISPLDKLGAKLMGTPTQWALARRLAKTLTAADSVYCTGEDVGFPLAALLARKPDRPKISLCVHNVARPKAKLFFQLFGLGSVIHRYAIVAPRQLHFLRDSLGVPESNLAQLPDQTDTNFFKPGLPTPNFRGDRSLIVSVGLEQRDYRTLAAATHSLPIDVKISGFSSDAKALANSFPEVLPANMEQRFYSWPDLLALYRSASLVVVSLHENRYLAGITTIMEAMACRRPVIVTATEGLGEYAHLPGILTQVQPGDSAGLQRAIQDALAHPERTEEQAQIGYEFVSQQHKASNQIDTLLKILDFQETKVLVNF
jgi:glycosyltransferase involved in cell wall biosynthesis